MVQRPDGAARPLPEEGRPQVLYIMGAGRSGSTILGVTLGNCADVFFAGELDHWLVRGGLPRRDGEPFERLWGSVLERARPPAELFGGVTKSLERSSALLDPRKLARGRRVRARYRLASERLYRALVEASGDAVIVDSSHYPLRARELRALPGIDLYLVYLVRDPQRVVASLGRTDVPERTFGPWTANAYLWLTHAVSTIVFLSHPSARRSFVRYEDFLADPQRVLTRILAMCGRVAAPGDLSRLRTGLPFHGNRLIRSETVGLTAEPAPSARDAPASRLSSTLTAVLQSPWRLVFSLLARAVPAPAARYDRADA